MHSMFGFLAVTAMLSAGNCAKSSNTNNQTPLATKSCDSRARVVCNCNVNHDSQVSDAIKKLETKMESLIALVNNTSTPKPNPQEKFPLQFSSLERQKLVQHCRREDWVRYTTDQVAKLLEHTLLGMRIGHQIKFVVINKHANSLYSLIADGKYRATSLGRITWKSLIGSQASLQTNCNKEGFNAVCSETPHSKARIGILGNNQRICSSCDSRIGFGTGGHFDDSNTCGNEATSSADNGNKHIKAMGYILVQ